MTKKVREVRSAVLTFRVTQRMYDDFSRKAGAANMTLRQWFEASIAENKTRVIARKKSGDVMAVIFHVNRAGLFLEQIAKHLVVQADAGKLTREEILLVIDKLDHLRALLNDGMFWATHH